MRLKTGTGQDFVQSKERDETMTKTLKLQPETKNLINVSKQEFAKASLALVRSAAGIVIALQFERVAALSTPAARRAKVSEIIEAIRAEFGGLEKEANRQAYDLCSLAFRIHAKLEKEADNILAEAKDAVWLEGQVSALCGRATVDAWKAWVVGETKATVKKTASEKLMAYLDKNGHDLNDADIDALMDWATKEKTKRLEIAQSLAA